MRAVRYAALLPAILAVVALGFIPRAAMAQDQPMTMNITITNSDIVSSVDTPAPGFYVVTVKNNSSDYRGIVMRGIDRGVSPYIRFSPVLAPGQQATFGWYFPSDRVVRMRDLLSCTHGATSCVAASYGGLTETLVFG